MPNDSLEKLQKKLVSTRQQIQSAIVMSGVFWGISFFSGSRFWFFPMVFMGILPFFDGLSKQRKLKERLNQLDSGPPEMKAKDKEILVFRLAKEQNGVLTPVTLTLEGGLSIDESEKVLEDLSKRGYASLEVGNDGKLMYVFSEFLPKLN